MPHPKTVRSHDERVTIMYFILFLSIFEIEPNLFHQNIPTMYANNVMEQIFYSCRIERGEDRIPAKYSHSVTLPLWEDFFMTVNFLCNFNVYTMPVWKPSRIKNLGSFSTYNGKEKRKRANSDKENVKMTSKLQEIVHWPSEKVPFPGSHPSNPPPAYKKRKLMPPDTPSIPIVPEKVQSFGVTWRIIRKVTRMKAVMK
jgi:hypothetical protein